MSQNATRREMLYKILLESILKMCDENTFFKYYENTRYKTVSLYILMIVAEGYFHIYLLICMSVYFT